MRTKPRPLRRQQPFRPLEPVRDWTDLSRADEVDIWNDGTIVASGRVDMRALDGSVFWLLQNDGRGRKMILKVDGLTVHQRAAPLRATGRRPVSNAALPHPEVQTSRMRAKASASDQTLTATDSQEK